jgi:hypothetical protein
MMRDFAVNLDAFIEKAETVELQSEGDELGFSDDFQEEWE